MGKVEVKPALGYGLALALIFVLQEIWQKGLLATTGCDALHLDNDVSLSQLSTFTVDEY